MPKTGDHTCPALHLGIICTTVTPEWELSVPARNIDNLENFAARHRLKAFTTPGELGDIYRKLNSTPRPLHRMTPLTKTRLAIDGCNSGASTLFDCCEIASNAVVEHAEFVEKEIARPPSAVATGMLTVPELVEYRNRARRVRTAALPSELPSHLLADLDTTADWQRLTRQLLTRISASVQTVSHAPWPLHSRRCTTVTPRVGRTHVAQSKPPANRRGICAQRHWSILPALTGSDEFAASASDWLCRKYLANDVQSTHMIALLAAFWDHRRLAHRYYHMKAELLTRVLTDAGRYPPGRRGIQHRKLLSDVWRRDGHLHAAWLRGGRRSPGPAAGRYHQWPARYTQVTWCAEFQLWCWRCANHTDLHRTNSGCVDPSPRTATYSIREDVRSPRYSKYRGAGRVGWIGGFFHRSVNRSGLRRISHQAVSAADDFRPWRRGPARNLIRQVALYEFEDELHRAVWRGESPEARTPYGSEGAFILRDQRWWRYADSFEKVDPNAPAIPRRSAWHWPGWSARFARSCWSWS